MHRLITSLSMALSIAAVPALASDVSHEQRGPQQKETNGSEARSPPTSWNDSPKEQETEQEGGSGGGEVGASWPSPSDDSSSSDEASLRKHAYEEFLKSVWTAGD